MCELMRWTQNRGSGHLRTTTLGTWEESFATLMGEPNRGPKPDELRPNSEKILCYGSSSGNVLILGLTLSEMRTGALATLISHLPIAFEWL